jgi:type III pantothenate kinase
MLLAADIGNTAIKFGLFDGETLTEKFSIPTKRNTSAGEIRLDVGDRLVNVRKAIVCSVVPELEGAMYEFLRDATGDSPTFVDNYFDFGLKITYEPLESLGTDRLVAAFAAVVKHGAPCVVCSLGTATTIDVVSEDREFLGGIIAAGVDALADALSQKASKLPKVEMVWPQFLIGNSTADAMRSGVYHGYVAMVEGLLKRIRGEYESTVVATGGNAAMAAELADAIEPDLVLNGLRMLAGRSS